FDCRGVQRRRLRQCAAHSGGAFRQPGDRERSRQSRFRALCAKLRRRGRARAQSAGAARSAQARLQAAQGAGTDRGAGRSDAVALGVHPYAAHTRYELRRNMEARSNLQVPVGEREPLTIRRVDAIPVALPLQKPMAMAGVTVSRALNILVRIEAADGTIGWGEAASAPTMTGDTLGSLIAAVRDHLAALLVGEDAWMRPALCRKLKRALFGNTGAHSAVEVALLDLAGQSSGLSVVDLIGGAVRRAVAPMWLL